MCGVHVDGFIRCFLLNDVDPYGAPMPWTTPFPFPPGVRMKSVRVYAGQRAPAETLGCSGVCGVDVRLPVRGLACSAVCAPTNARRIANVTAQLSCTDYPYGRACARVSCSVWRAPRDTGAQRTLQWNAHLGA